MSKKFRDSDIPIVEARTEPKMLVDAQDGKYSIPVVVLSEFQYAKLVGDLKNATIEALKEYLVMGVSKALVDNGTPPPAKPIPHVAQGPSHIVSPDQLPLNPSWFARDEKEE